MVWGRNIALNAFAKVGRWAKVGLHKFQGLVMNGLWFVSLFDFLISFYFEFVKDGFSQLY